MPTPFLLKQRSLGFIGMVLLIGLPAALLGQYTGNQLIIETRTNNENSIDSVYHDEHSKTIDFFFTAKEGSRQFWSFDENNLKITETFGKITDTLDVVFQGKLTDPTHFGEREVYQVKTRSPNFNYHNELRTYFIYWINPNTKEVHGLIELTQNYGFPYDFNLVEKYAFADVVVICLLILVVLLLILSELVPWIYTRRFISRYAVPYSQVQKPGERKLHPITGRPLEPNEQVVNKCGKDICNVPLKIWQNRNYQCMHCPRQCDGNAKIWTRRFFSQLGDAKKLNWLWFGALGGALAWGLDHLFHFLPEINDNKVINRAIFGFAVGVSYSLTLSLVEELGQGRYGAFLRLTLRVLMGGTMGAILFYLIALIGDSSILNGIGWLLFCVLLGLVVSFRSSISWSRGMLSGFIAGLVSALLYYFFPYLSDNPQATIIKMLALLTAGAVLGFGIIQVVKQLEKAELQVIAPAHRSGMVFALDNFLKNNGEVIIGKDMKRATVRVKWDDDQVLDNHAVMKSNGKQVTITALPDAELWINNERIPAGRSHLLKGGEIIALNRQGKSAFKYLQKN